MKFTGPVKIIFRYGENLDKQITLTASDVQVEWNNNQFNATGKLPPYREEEDGKDTQGNSR